RPATARAPAAATPACASARPPSGWTAGWCWSRPARKPGARSALHTCRHSRESTGTTIEAEDDRGRVRPSLTRRRRVRTLFPGAQPQAEGFLAALGLHQPHRHRHPGGDPGGGGLAVGSRYHPRRLQGAPVDRHGLGAGATEAHGAGLAVTSAVMGISAAT